MRLDVLQYGACGSYKEYDIFFFSGRHGWHHLITMDYGGVRLAHGLYKVKRKLGSY